MSLKPLTDYERSLLSALDEDPNEHQQRLAKRLRGEKLPAAKPDTLLKKLQEGKVAIGPTIAEAALALEQRAALWREDAYCIFIAHVTCKGCEKKTVMQRDPNVYLRSRMTRHPTMTRVELMESRTYMYVPVRELANASLPRFRVSSFHTNFACESCFEEAVCQPTPSTSDSPVAIELPAAHLNSSAESSPFPTVSSPVPTLAEAFATSIESSLNYTDVLMNHESGRNLETSQLPKSPSEQPLVIAGDLTFPTAELVFAKGMSLNEG